MSHGLTSAHPFTPPTPGHVDGPNACAECGAGPRASCHPQYTQAELRLARVVEVATAWQSGLVGMGRNEFGVAALRAVLAAAEGETDPAKLGFSGLRMRLTGVPNPRPSGEQHTLPLTA